MPLERAPYSSAERVDARAERGVASLEYGAGQAVGRSICLQGTLAPEPALIPGIFFQNVHGVLFSYKISQKSAKN